MTQASNVVADLLRISCNVLSTAALDKTEIIRILTDETATQKIEINDTLVNISYIATHRLYHLSNTESLHHFCFH